MYFRPEGNAGRWSDAGKQLIRRTLSLPYGGSELADISQALGEAAYQAYERALLARVLAEPVPRHLAIIMDGNRRFAAEMGMNSLSGHEIGRDKLEEILNWCLETGIKVLTVYAFSTENLKRSPEEVAALMRLFAENFRRAGDDERTHRHRIRVRAIGQMSLLPPDVQDSIRYAEEKTEGYDSYFFNVAVAYGGREEILMAIREIAREARDGKVRPEDIDEGLVSAHLYTSDLPDPDLILRTSGEERISNFLLWQLAYSELYFADVFWPGLRKVDFLRAIRSYQKRKRRFGK
ncbi:MAG: di-trans,poly-cis-decaprenylcistransferase [Euryarchaeota archaeon]|nr:di-trans,poly-cis-decaprenylcistransferase [Euryarchaeota archaeon]